MKETAVLINFRDRPTEVAMLLLSLYNQTYRDFDIYLLDDMSGTPPYNYHFFNCINFLLLNRDIRIFLRRSDFPLGVSRARQEIVDWAMEKDYKYFLRVDDDVVLESDFVERLIKLMDSFDIGSGVTPPMSGPSYTRESKFIGEIANRVVLDKEGNYIWNGDDCGMKYMDEKILPAHHFRSSAIMKRAVLEKVKYFPTKFGMHGFREEQIFSYKAQLEGMKIGVDLQAIAWHQQTPSGGERFPEQAQMINFNETILREYTRENKEKLREIFTDIDLTEQERMKETNTAR